MTTRTQMLMVLFAFLSVFWLGLLLLGLRADVQAVLEGLRAPRPSAAENAVPPAPRRAPPDHRWTF
jgi:hypothetical protein